MSDPDIRLDGIAIADAFAALPLATPARSAWPLLATRLPATAPRRWAWPITAAAAAVVAVAVLTLPGQGGRTVPATNLAATGHTSPAMSAQLDALMGESARLERLLADASDNVVGNASTMSLSLALEDRLHALDAALDRTAPGSAQRLSLWRQRVELLRASAGLETSRRYYAAQGRELDVGLVAAL